MKFLPPERVTRADRVLGDHSLQSDEQEAKSMFLFSIDTRALGTNTNILAGILSCAAQPRGTIPYVQMSQTKELNHAGFY